MLMEARWEGGQVTHLSEQVAQQAEAVSVHWLQGFRA